SLSGSLEYGSIQKIFKWFIFPNKFQADDQLGHDASPSTNSNGMDDSFIGPLNHLKAIINSSKQILFLIDKKMDIIAFNKHAEKIISSFTSKQVEVGNNILSFLSEEDAKGLSEVFSE